MTISKRIFNGMPVKHFHHNRDYIHSSLWLRSNQIFRNPKQFWERIPQGHGSHWRYTKIGLSSSLKERIRLLSKDLMARLISIPLNNQRIMFPILHMVLTKQQKTRIKPLKVTQKTKKSYTKVK
jgi:hypothetical protein